ncbi:hypothetical protein BGX28_009384, partial [Mortierella sp. GBA30]
DFQAFSKSVFRAPEEQKAALDAGIDWRGYVLRRSFRTNGHKLHVMTFSLTQSAPPQTPVRKPNTTRAKLVDTRTLLQTKEDVDDIFVPDRERVVVGVDPGMKQTATFCILSSDTQRHPVNISLTHGAQSHVTRKFMRGLEHAKSKAGIDVLERQIEPVTCPQAEEGQQGEAWRMLHRSVGAHALAAVKNKAINRVISAMGFKATGEDPVCTVFVVGGGESRDYDMLRRVEDVDYMLPVRGDNGGEEQERLLGQLRFGTRSRPRNMGAAPLHQAIFLRWPAVMDRATQMDQRQQQLEQLHPVDGC